MALAIALQCRAHLRYVLGLVPLLCLCGAVGPAVSTVAAADTAAIRAQETQVYPQATELTLQDQYDKTRVYRFPQETISVMFFADYSGLSSLSPGFALSTTVTSRPLAFMASPISRQCQGS